MAQFERFTGDRRIAPNTRPNLGGEFSNFDIASVNDSSAINRSVRLSKTQLNRLRKEEARVKLQDDSILAAEKSVENRTKLVALSDEINQFALANEDTSQMISKFEEKSSVLVEETIKGIEDPETARRVELALQRDLALFAGQVATSQIKIRKDINSRRFERTIRTASATTRLAANTDITLDTYQNLTDELGFGRNIFDKPQEKKLQEAIRTEIVKGGAEALVESNPKQALDDLQKGRYDKILKSTEINDLITSAKTKIGVIDQLAVFEFEKTTQNNIAHMENTGYLLPNQEPDFSVFPEKGNKRSAAIAKYEYQIKEAKKTFTDVTLLKKMPVNAINSHLVFQEGIAKTKGDFARVSKMKIAAQRIRSAYNKNSKEAAIMYSKEIAAAADLHRDGSISSFDFNQKLSSFYETMGVTPRYLTDIESEKLAAQFSNPFKRGSKTDQDSVQEYINLVKEFDKSNTRGEESFTGDIMRELFRERDLAPQVATAMHYALNDNGKAVVAILVGNQLKKAEGGFEGAGIKKKEHQDLIDINIRENDDLQVFYKANIGGSLLRASSEQSLFVTTQNVAAALMYEAGIDNLSPKDAVEQAKDLLLKSYAPYNYGRSSIFKANRVFIPVHIGPNGSAVSPEIIRQKMKSIQSPSFYAGIDTMGKYSSEDVANLFARKGLIKPNLDGESFRVYIRQDNEVVFASQGGHAIEWDYKDIIKKEVPGDVFIRDETIQKEVVGAVVDTGIAVFEGAKQDIDFSIEKAKKDVKRLKQRTEQKRSDELSSKTEKMYERQTAVGPPVGKRQVPLLIPSIGPEIKRLSDLSTRIFNSEDFPETRRIFYEYKVANSDTIPNIQNAFSNFERMSGQISQTQKDAVNDQLKIIDSITKNIEKALDTGNFDKFERYSDKLHVQLMRLPKILSPKIGLNK